MNPLFMSIALIMGLGLFTFTMIKKVRLLMALGPAERMDRMKERFKSVLVLAMGQKRLVGRQKERSSGLMHALIFWGFCILLIRSIVLYGQGFVHDFQLPFLGEHYLTGYIYLWLKDIMEGVVLIMIIWAVLRRAIIKPERMHNTPEAYLVLGMIGLLMVSDLLFDGARYHLIEILGNPGSLHFFNNPQYGPEFSWTPVSVGAASLLSGLGPESAAQVMTFMFWTHIITQLIFLNLLPFGKHFHVITALPNVFFKSLDYPHENIALLDMENEDAWEDETLGLNHIHQLTWKQGLDLYTCTECGRCKDVCPAWVTDKPLNLKDFNDTLKQELHVNADKILQRAELTAGLEQLSDEDEIQSQKETIQTLNSEKQLVGEVIEEDTLWACTTCRACEAVCPVTIEHVPRIIAMRQGATLMAESYPKELNPALKGLERNGNPWGIGYDKRADWAEGLDVPIMADNPDVDYLLWVGCAGSFDDRAKKVSQSLVKILQAANISFAILGTEEKCTGDFARRAGNEMMFQMMAEENIETLNKYKVKKIITACPHCLTTLKNDYPQLGGNFDVIHHTQLIHDLIKTKKLRLKKGTQGTITYHDPCYLGRYNNIYDDPRQILNTVSSNRVSELDRNAKESFCCGAGGGRMWMEETIGTRINRERTSEIIQNDVSSVAVGCPFCLTMIEDGLKELGKEEAVSTLDIAELVAKNLE